MRWSSDREKKQGIYKEYASAVHELKKLSAHIRLFKQIGIELEFLNISSNNWEGFSMLFRGVQYVHWVMHKCIMVKVGGKNTRKVCKKLLNFLKTEGKIFEIGGK